MEKRPLLDQNHGLTPLEKCQFFDFLNLLFLQPKKPFFRSRKSQKTFSQPILLKKKKLEKAPFLNQNDGLTPLEKCQFFDLLNFLFLWFRKRFFVLEYRKRHFPSIYCLKIIVGKRAIFRPKPWVNPIGKMQFFDLLNFLFLYPRKGLFCSKIS